MKVQLHFIRLKIVLKFSRVVGFIFISLHNWMRKNQTNFLNEFLTDFELKYGLGKKP